MALKKSSKLPHAAALKQILERCSSFGKKNGYNNEEDLPDDNRSRYVIPISWLAHPKFQSLLQRSEEEFGFNHDWCLTIPCEEVVFRSLTSMIRSSYDD
ncbi:hypothetical protein I3760_08G131400 [Carya illinoinensis]|nr:hypothetical protein I3760_08G131400 [Carya illinoinensis]